MPDPITPEERARWRELDEKATKGPWKARGMGGDSYLMAPTHKWNEPTMSGMCPIALPRPYTDMDGASRVDYSSAGFAHDDATLIAEYRNAVPRLLDRVEALEASIREHDARTLGCKVENLDEALARLKKEHDLHD